MITRRSSPSLLMERAFKRSMEYSGTTHKPKRGMHGGHAPWKRAALTVDLGSLVSLAVSVVPGQVVSGKKQRTFF
jgi:hypothetical protein